MKKLIFPNTALRRISKNVEENNINPLLYTSYINNILQKMWNVMYMDRAVGLSAVQINVPLNIVVIYAEEEKYELINPEYLFKSTEESVSTEGCISIPGYFDKVLRSKYIKIKYKNKNLEPKVLEADNLLSFIIQHEMDHLAGKLFIDYLSPMKKDRIKQRVKRFMRKHTEYEKID